MGDLTGATLVAMDTTQGHYVYRRTIFAPQRQRWTHHRRATMCRRRRLRQARAGMGLQVLRRGQARLIGHPGRVVVRSNSSRLYLWPPSAGNPASQNLEISRRDSGFNLSHRSYTTLDGLTLEFFERECHLSVQLAGNPLIRQSVRNARMRYANRGLYLGQECRPCDRQHNRWFHAGGFRDRLHGYGRHPA